MPKVSHTKFHRQLDEKKVDYLTKNTGGKSVDDFDAQLQASDAVYYQRRGEANTMHKMAVDAGGFSKTDNSKNQSDYHKRHGKPSLK